jgi:hypothetical protein
MRRALAHAVLLSDPPDLIILDEFQRYRFLVSKEGREDRLVTALLSSARRTLPAVLLLSATPYKLFATRWEESQGVEAHHELFELVEFLGGTEGSSIRTRVEILFQTFGDSIRRIASTASDAEGFTSFIIAAEEQRRDIHQLLSKLMSRTERATADVDDGSKTEFLDCDISGEDVHAFRHLVESFQLRDRSDALPYWLSVPLPAQALGQRYQAWRNATFHRDGQLKKLSLQIRNHIGPRQTWPHPKLRAMQKVAPTESLSLPWAAPSLPWWPLSGPWANALPNPKVLLFSRFKATPQSIAALTSFAVESAYLSGHPLGYERVWRKRRLQPGPGRLPLMALFHPSGFLIERIDPLKSASYELRSIRASVRQQLIGAMKSVGVNVQRKTAKHRERRRPTWSLVSALDNRAGFRNLSQSAWSNVASTDRRLYQLVAKWHAAPDVDWVSPRELEDLVTTALGAPGVVVGRALLRHYNKALTEGSYSLVRLSWSGLRVYLDNPIFWSRLGGRKAPTDTLIHAVVDGGLESVLDEHFWTLRQASPTDGTEIADELCEALNVVTGSFSFHVVGRRSKARIRIRCHAAVPFGGTEQEPGRPSNSTGEQQARSDELRKAFNAPFWPYVLATTSVGQEGLDFHTWCSRVAHWDLCYGPLDLEQREGRIQRFAGLLVRQQLAASIGKQHTIDSARVSPWCAIARIAECERSDSSGLSPWWVLAGAGVTRYVFRLPQGRDVLRFSMLREQRFVYRLALGQPNQEDFLDMLTKSDSHKLKLLRSLALDLSAFNHQAANGVKNTMRAAASAPNVTV